jgi:UDP-N-acetylglucosamine 2-epimerase (non-hydrolysing)
MAPVVERLQESAHFDVRVAVSAQHRDMLDQVLKAFRLKSHMDMDIMRKGQSLFDLTSRIIKNFEPVLEKSKPDLVLVHGDTTTTLGGALASYYKKIPVGHVEAGLRTFDRYRPFPEEINRQVTDRIATLFFAPTSESKKNLLKENISPQNIFVTGNTVIDALKETVRLKLPIKNPHLKKILNQLPSGSKVILLTAHRRENFGHPFKCVLQAIQSAALRFPQYHWIYPVHPNPNVKIPATQAFHKHPTVHLIDPLDYTDLVRVMNLSSIVVTDSGGLQEEAPSLGKPVLVLRDVTERPEAVHAGTVRLVGTSKEKILKNLYELITNKKSYQRMSNAVNPYGDGKGAVRIRQAVEWYFGLRRDRPKSFVPRA